MPKGPGVISDDLIREIASKVPPANAFELYQGLQDVGVETKLVIYKGFGHGITKPKERLTVVWEAYLELRY